MRLVKPTPPQQQIANSTARFRVVACGRRFGKTETGKRLILLRAVRGQRCWWLSPTYLMASQVWRDLITTCAGHKGVTINHSERRIDFNNGGLIAVRSTHTPDFLRGMGLDFAVLDEAAFMDAGVWSQVVRPMLLERRGGAAFLSSPNGRNWFWQVYQLGLDPAQKQWAAFHFTSYDNPLIDPAEIDAVRAITPERIWREEYLAEFLDDSGQVFRGFREAATVPPGQGPQPGGYYVGGVDWGRDGDFTVIAIIDGHTRRLVALDRFNQVNWATQRGRLAAMCQRWQPAVVWAEANSAGLPNIEALQAEGLPVRPFTTTSRSKRPLIEALALAIERGELALLRDDVLLGELAAYRLTRLPGGGYQYGAPPGQHDDTVIALALAWHGLTQGGVALDFA